MYFCKWVSISSCIQYAAQFSTPVLCAALDLSQCVVSVLWKLSLTFCSAVLFLLSTPVLFLCGVRAATQKWNCCKTYLLIMSCHLCVLNRDPVDTMATHVWGFSLIIPERVNERFFGYLTICSCLWHPVTNTGTCQVMWLHTPNKSQLTGVTVSSACC